MSRVASSPCTRSAPARAGLHSAACRLRGRCPTRPFRWPLSGSRFPATGVVDERTWMAPAGGAGATLESLYDRRRRIEACGIAALPLWPRWKSRHPWSSSTRARIFVFCSMLLGRRIMAGSISPWPVVKSGANGHPIKTLQYLLRARGHSIAADGVFGPNTETAVKAFQASHGLAADGIVAPMAWAALVVQVRKGSQGDAVRGVQEEFQFRNLSGDPSKGPQIDGIFGPATEASVRGFQQALSLDIPSVAVDGIVGPVTWQALVSGMLSF
jgi:Putative peptidoglycan binding domain